MFPPEGSGLVLGFWGVYFGVDSSTQAQAQPCEEALGPLSHNHRGLNGW